MDNSLPIAMKALYDMFMRRSPNLGFDGFKTCSMHNISGNGCNYKFTIFFII